jgi:hypothetical protein
VLGGTRNECISVFDAEYVCVCCEGGVSEGCGFALCLRDECVSPSPRSDRYFRTGVVGRVGVVSICDLVG